MISRLYKMDVIFLVRHCKASRTSESSGITGPTATPLCRTIVHIRCMCWEWTTQQCGNIQSPLKLNEFILIKNLLVTIILAIKMKARYMERTKNKIKDKQ